MLQHRLNVSLFAGFIFAACVGNVTPAFAQRPGQFESEIQSAMRSEAQAKAANTASQWCAAGETWFSQGLNTSRNESHQDWVKETQNPATRELSVAIIKRAIACFNRSYDLEGEHDTPMSRDRSNALRCLMRSYQSLIKVDPQNGSWHYLLGEAMCSKGWYKQGAAELKTAAALGGTGGTKATALMTHVKPYVQKQIALEQSLAKENARIAAQNAKLPQYQSSGGGTMSVGRMEYINRMNALDKIRQYNQTH